MEKDQGLNLRRVQGRLKTLSESITRIEAQRGLDTVPGAATALGDLADQLADTARTLDPSLRFTVPIPARADLADPGIVVGLLRTMLEPETTEEHRKALEEPETSALFGSLRHTLDPTVRAERLEGLEGDVRAYNASVERMLGAIRDARSAR